MRAAPLIGVRPHAQGFIVGEVYPRMRHQKPDTELRRAHHVGSPREAANVVRAVLAQMERGAEVGPVPQVNEEVELLISHAALKPQAQGVLRVMQERGSITGLEALQAGLGIRLAARVLEIREAFGEASVRTEYETKGGARYARYFWDGPSEDVQRELGL